jgi:ATP-dependent DNA ligase
MEGTMASTNWVKRKGVMLCVPFEEERLQGDSRKAWNSWPVLTQPKLDGERCRVVTNNGRLFLLSSTEEFITSVPHLNEELRLLNCPYELDGELYVHGWTFEQIHSVVSRRVNQHELSSKMEFHVFDYVSDEPQLVRSANLTKWFRENVPTCSPVKLVSSQVAQSFSWIMSQYEQYIANGYEGIIVRHTEASYERKRSSWIMKFKPKRTDYYPIVGFVEEQDQFGVPKNMLGAFVCLSNDGEQFNLSASCLTHDKKKELWLVRENLLEKMLKVKYQCLTAGRKVPKFVSELEVTDIKLKDFNELEVTNTNGHC